MKKDYIVELREDEAEELMDEHWVSELVRCEDCKYWKNGYRNFDVHPWLPCMEIHTNCKWFCGYGDRIHQCASGTS